ncbi:MAG: CPBP family intramembrane metalloprotease [Cytophagales bacterium]|jgi:hypothetical protein|nr:CPBP family intramembrane metalloprotease [Cytophagales bacterium]
MKKIIGYLLTHVRADFDRTLYLRVLLFLTVCTAINYYLDFEDSIVDSYVGQPVRYLWYFLVYGFAYFGTIAIMNFSGRLSGIFRNRLFWIYSLTGIVVLSIEPEFSYSMGIWAGNQNAELYYWNYKIMHETAPLFCTLVPLYIFYRLCDKKTENFYGLTVRNVDFRPYALMLLIMVPPIFWASTQPDFLDTYPTYRQSLPTAQLGQPSWVLALAYEAAYGVAFVMTELMFRGFLVIGMAAVLGSEAVLPMVVTYAFLHFGKPLGETVGSVFGGYILGVLALYSRNIWGGVAIHLGVAWLMELAAWTQK